MTLQSDSNSRNKRIFSLIVTAEPSYSCAILKMILKLLVDVIWTRQLVDRLYELCRHLFWYFWMLYNDDKICWYNLPLDLQKDASFVRRALFYVNALRKIFRNADISSEEGDLQFFNALPALRKTFGNSNNYLIKNKLHFFMALLESVPSSYYDIYMAILPILDNTADLHVPMLSQLLERTLSLFVLHGRPGWPNQDMLELSMFLARKIDKHRGWAHRYVRLAWVKSGLPLFETLEGMHTTGTFRDRFTRWFSHRDINYAGPTIAGDKETMLLIAKHCLPAYKVKDFEKANWSLRSDKTFMLKAVYRDGSLLSSGHRKLHDQTMGTVAFANSTDAIHAYVKKQGMQRGIQFCRGVLARSHYSLQSESYYHIILWYQATLPHHMEPLIWKHIFEYLGVKLVGNQYCLSVIWRARHNLLEFFENSARDI